MPTDHVIACPGCKQPLRLPTDALGKTGHCPHCRAAFRVAADGTPQLVAPSRFTLNLPRPLLVPAYGLLMLGLAGVLVNGYLSVLFATRPGFDVEFARGRVFEVRSAEEMSGSMRPAEWEYDKYAAVGGVAAAEAAGVAEKDRRSEELAQSWAAGMRPLHLVSVAVSAVSFLGGVAILRGRWLWLAFLGCAAAILNVNHLCCLPGAVAGVWGILALSRDDVRTHFRRPSG